MSLFLFCTPRTSPITPPSSSLCAWGGGGHRHLFPPRLRQEEAFFLTALVDKTNRVYFLSASPPQPVSKNVFFYFGFGRPGVFFSFVWMCIYYCTRVEEQNVCFRVAGAFLQCMLLYVWMVRPVQHFFKNETTGCSSVLSLYTLYVLH